MDGWGAMKLIALSNIKLTHLFEVQLLIGRGRFLYRNRLNLARVFSSPAYSILTVGILGGRGG